MQVGKATYLFKLLVHPPIRDAHDHHQQSPFEFDYNAVNKIVFTSVQAILLHKCATLMTLTSLKENFYHKKCEGNS